MSNRFDVRRATFRLVVIAAASLLFGSGAARADVLLQLHRLSDTDALLVGSGFVGSLLPAQNLHALFLSDPFSVRPSPLVTNPLLVESDMHAGAFAFNFANDAGSGIGGSFTNTIYIGKDVGVLPFEPIPSNELLEGTMLLHLSGGESFAPVGATGDVYWGTTTGNIKGILSGSWEMVPASPVPEPSTIAFFFAGILFLAFWHCRARHDS